MSAIQIVTDYTTKLFNLLFASDSNLITDEYSEIMANKEDKEKYYKAIEEARKNDKEERVELSSGETLIVSA